MHKRISLSVQYITCNIFNERSWVCQEMSLKHCETPVVLMGRGSVPKKGQRVPHLYLHRSSTTICGFAAINIASPQRGTLLVLSWCLPSQLH